MRHTNRSGIHEKSEEDQAENIRWFVPPGCEIHSANRTTDARPWTLELRAKEFLDGDWLLTQAALATNC